MGVECVMVWLLVAMGLAVGLAAPAAGANSTVEGVFWSPTVESAMPTGFGATDARSWAAFVAAAPVLAVHDGCGRMQNRLLTFRGGVRACARYRQSADQIQGEVYSFVLGRQLGLGNLVPSAAAAVEPGGRWASVGREVAKCRWARGRPLVLTRFVGGLAPATIPPLLRNATRRLHPQDVSALPPADAAELAQWSDLILFDYLTANLDRLVNNLYNLQWNPAMMDAPAHNLARHPSGLLVFLDNESGLLHGYRLLDKYEPYHSVMLEALCVFRRPTVLALEELRTGDLGALLAGPDRKLVPPLPDRSLRILRQRLDRVSRQISWCASQYPNR